MPPRNCQVTDSDPSGSSRPLAAISCVPQFAKSGSTFESLNVQRVTAHAPRPTARRRPSLRTSVQP
ncbi:MAG: hypothetical protein Q4D70_04810, partial [bacterium]|nr:hypothetical protein [bacterium]